MCRALALRAARTISRCRRIATRAMRTVGAAAVGCEVRGDASAPSRRGIERQFRTCATFRRGASLDAAGELDRHAKQYGGHDQKGGPVYTRALLATFAFAGLRIGELIALGW